MPAVASEPEGLQRVQSRCFALGHMPCQFATCMNKMVAGAEIVARFKLQGLHHHLR